MKFTLALVCTGGALLSALHAQTGGTTAVDGKDVVHPYPPLKSYLKGEGYLIYGYAKPGKRPAKSDKDSAKRETEKAPEPISTSELAETNNSTRIPYDYFSSAAGDTPGLGITLNLQGNFFDEGNDITPAIFAYMGQFGGGGDEDYLIDAALKANIYFPEGFLGSSMSSGYESAQRRFRMNVGAERNRYQAEESMVDNYRFIAVGEWSVGSFVEAWKAGKREGAMPSFDSLFNNVKLSKSQPVRLGVAYTEDLSTNAEQVTFLFEWDTVSEHLFEKRADGKEPFIKLGKRVAFRRQDFEDRLSDPKRTRNIPPALLDNFMPKGFSHYSIEPHFGTEGSSVFQRAARGDISDSFLKASLDLNILLDADDPKSGLRLGDLGIKYSLISRWTLDLNDNFIIQRGTLDFRPSVLDLLPDGMQDSARVFAGFSYGRDAPSFQKENQWIAGVAIRF